MPFFNILFKFHVNAQCEAALKCTKHYLVMSYQQNSLTWGVGWPRDESNVFLAVLIFCFSHSGAWSRLSLRVRKLFLCEWGWKCSFYLLKAGDVLLYLLVYKRDGGQTVVLQRGQKNKVWDVQTKLVPQCWPSKRGCECWIVSFVKVQNLDGHSMPRSMSGISGWFRSCCLFFSNHHFSGGTPTAHISLRRRFLSPPAVLRSTFSYNDQVWH